MTCKDHYEYGFDEKVTATGHPSMFLKGGNDSNFGMIMTALLSKSDGAFEDESEPERSEPEPFQPQRVTFYVRTDSPNSGARARPARSTHARRADRADRNGRPVAPCSHLRARARARARVCPPAQTRATSSSASRTR